MRAWALFGPTVTAHIADVPPLVLPTASPITRPDAVLRVGGDEPRDWVFLKALELAQVFAAQPSPDSKGPLLHVLETLSRLRPAEKPSYDELVTVGRLQREIHGLAANPANAELAWVGSAIARFAETYSDGKTITALCRENYSKARGVRWKAHADSYYGPEQARATYDVLRTAGFVPSADGPLRFVSAAANAGTHEAAFFERDAEVTPDRKGGRQFIVGDIAEVPRRTLPGPSFGPGFLHVRWDAHKLPLAANSIDIIWDRKGRTWFALRNDRLKDVAQTRSPLLALAVLQHYHELLKPGGHVVLDAIEGIEAQWEESTAGAIRTNTESGGVDLLSLIRSRFDVRFVGDGVTRCLVLTKR
ncbi:MAG: hypothetical protein ACAI38_17775 [Myxococcota bacterium]